jgi:hypothetical protein
MDFKRKEKRIGILSAQAVFLIITAFWTLIRPGISKYTMHRSEMKLKERLQGIRPPAGGTPGDIEITRVPKFDYISATRLDPTTLDCISGEKYYRNEFTNAGFSYNGEKVDPKQHTKTLSFGGQGYDATLLCAEVRRVPGEPDFHIYVITMWSVR